MNEFTIDTRFSSNPVRSYETTGTISELVENFKHRLNGAKPKTIGTLIKRINASAKKDPYFLEYTLKFVTQLQQTK